MKLLLSLFLIFTLSIYAQSKSIDPYKNIHYYTLDNGLQIYLLSDEKAENTQVELTVNVGYDIETDETYGLAHLVEHMVFRDQRVPYHDYLDYIKDQGGTYVNGFTKRYETGYLTTIKSSQSYWIVETFSQMLFDKNVTLKDIEVEKGALQTEIGESHWYSKSLTQLKNFITAILPPPESFNQNEFSIEKAKELPDYYHAQENNKKFTFDQIMQHYNTYYYPANMTLMVVGNFSTEKMKETIEKHYGKITKKGTKSVKEPLPSPVLNHRPFKRFYEGVGQNSAYIGAKYILDDYKKYLILDAYTHNLADRLQQKMRNKDGKTYSVNSYNFNYQKVGVASVYFDALHDEFASNLHTVKEMLSTDLKHIDDETIEKSLKSYIQNNYLSIEHDNESLMGLLKTAKYLREDENITRKSSYELFKTITADEFRKTINSVFTPENSYTFTYRDYYFFPMEMSLLSILSIILFIYFYIRLGRTKLKKKNLIYTQRETLIQRRLSNKFMGFLLLTLTIIITNIVWDWMQYLLSKWITGDPYYLFTIDVPYSYIITILDPIIYIILFILFYANLWRYYARLDIIDKGIIAIGNRILFIPKEQIASFEVVTWKFSYYKNIIGTTFRFWLPLLKVTLNDGNTYYLRSSNAQYLKEDLEKYLGDS